ncbi:MAG: GDSL-type esterase/lipase family protein [Kiritimatiellaeota bacterium]|nr:GDSL-type esterase/lipase family protein [Kiritimatiellota bacterium]
MAYLTCAWALGAVVASSAPTQNLLTSGGFEDALQGWGHGNAAVFEVTTGGAAEGEHFIAVQCPNTKDNALRRIVGGLTAGQDYTLTFKTRKNTIADLRIILRNPATKSYMGMVKPAPSDDWQVCQHNFKAPGPEVGLEISARAPGRCDLDDFAIVPGKGAPMPNSPKASVESTAAKGGPFADQIAAFESADKLNPPKPGAVLFVGSSTIKRWRTLAKYFPEVTVINRGYGGAMMADVLLYVDCIVIPYQAKHILVYAGDNDLAAKATPQDVLRDFKTFVAKVHAVQSGTPITFVSIKPSPHRMRIASKVAEANRLVQDFVKGDPKLGYVDITATLLGPDGKPDPALFEKDGLHLTEAGYERFAVPIKARVLSLK